MTARDIVTALKMTGIINLYSGTLSADGESWIREPEPWLLALLKLLEERVREEETV